MDNDVESDNIGENEQLNVSQNPSMYGGQAMGRQKIKVEAKHKAGLDRIDDEFKINFQDPRIKSKFALGDKIKKAFLPCTRCCKKPWATAERIRE